jgi:hypothetical protein
MPAAKSRSNSASEAGARVASLQAAEATGVSAEASADAASPPASPDAPGTVGASIATQVAASGQEATAAVSVQAMMDIEAKLAIEVKDVAGSVNQVRALVAAAAGQILEESIEDERRHRPSANLTVRVPSSGALDFLGRLETTGVVRSRQVNSRDVGKEYFDATLRVRSLERVLLRYQELLSKSSTIDEALRVEEQITRVSGEIETIKGELRWLRDRVARATVRLEIYGKGDWVEPVVTPEAKFYPGLRAVGSWDWRGDAGNRYGVGAGLSMRFSRHFSIDFDGLQNTKATGGNLELSLLTLGGEFYSDYLGAGQRRWFNPYLGVRGGYGRIDSNNQLVLGGGLGLEIFKYNVAVLNLDLRVFGAFGHHLGSHLVVLPALGVNFAF